MAEERAWRLLMQSGAAASSSGKATKLSSGGKRDDDVVIVASVRTAIGRARKGGLARTSAVQMLTAALKGVLARVPQLEPKLVEDVVVGTVLAPGSTRANEARIAALLAGMPNTTSVRTVNRQCSSGLQAIADVAAAIHAGYIQVGIGAGVESMSLDVMAWGQTKIDPEVKSHAEARSCLIPMGLTSENVAEKFKLTREQQDRLAVQSHERAAAAIESGRFRDEIVPVRTTIQDPKTGAIVQTTFDVDDGVRPGTTLEALSKLKPAFKEGGSTTAGNASQVSDGAAAALLMKRSTAVRLGLKPMATFRSFAVAGVPPEIMGIGPAAAIPVALKQAGLTKDQIDVYEINEAFASQAGYCVQKLGLDWSKVNPNGGAIALGHPLGCTGARMTATLLYEMKRRKARYGVVSMCIGSGMGAAAVYEREG